MVGLALQNRRGARAAHTLFARRLDLYAGGGQGFHHRLVLGNEDDLARAGELDFEAAVVVRLRRCGREVLVMDP